MTDLDKLRTTVGAALGCELPTPEGIRAWVDQLRRSFPGVTDDEALALVHEFETVHGVTMRDGAALQDTGFQPWLEDARSGWDPYYWDRYRTLLANRNFSGHVLATLDDVTDRILGFLENPAREGAWDRRGMVMGARPVRQDRELVSARKPPVLRAVSGANLQSSDEITTTNRAALATTGR